MRLLHLLEAAQGGTRRHVLDLLPRLAKRGFQCGLIYSSRRYPAFVHDAAHLETLGVQTWDIPMARGFDPITDARALQLIAARIAEFEPDLLHSHSSKAGMLGRMAAFTKGVPAIYTPHCIAFDTQLPLRQRRAARLVESALAPITAHYIAVSHAERRAIARLSSVAKQRVSVVHNGLDLPALDALFQSESPASKPTDGPTIGSFGRLTPQKNQAVLIRALAILRNEIPARLLLVGGGEDEAQLRSLACALKVENFIEWTGELEEARPLLNRCDIVAQPSRWEGCPYSILEAMAAQRALVVSPLPPLHELLSNEEAIFARATPHHFAAACAELWRDEACREDIAKCARARIERDFRLRDMVEKTTRVYQTLA